MNRLRPHHIGILVKDIKASTKFYVDYLGGEQIYFTGDPGKKGGLKFNFIRFPYSDWMIELLEPTTEVLKRMLEEKGDGYQMEVCFCVDDIEKFYDEMTEKGVKMTDHPGNPVVGEKYKISAPTGNKYLYFPKEVSHGTWIEILEESGTVYNA